MTKIKGTQDGGLREKISKELSHAYYNGLDHKGWTQYEEKTAIDAILGASQAHYQPQAVDSARDINVTTKRYQNIYHTDFVVHEPSWKAGYETAMKDAREVLEKERQHPNG